VSQPLRQLIEVPTQIPSSVYEVLTSCEMEQHKKSRFSNEDGGL
jgi:hypothetical protein